MTTGYSFITVDNLPEWLCMLDSEAAEDFFREWLYDFTIIFRTFWLYQVDY